MGYMVNKNLDTTTLNEVKISLFLMECKDGVVIHNNTDDIKDISNKDEDENILIWVKIDWNIDNGFLIIINKDTQEKFEINDIGKWTVSDTDYYVEFNRDKECIWIEMI